MSTTEGTENSDAADGRERSKLKQKNSHTLLRSVAANLENDLYCPDEDSIDDILAFKHGLFLSHTLRLKGRIKNIIYYPKEQAFKVMHSEHVYQYCNKNLVQAFPLNAREMGKELDKILYAAECDEYIGVCKQSLLLFDNSFNFMYEAECAKQISTATYNQWSGEVITAGVGYFQTWVFRKGAKVLAPAITYTDGLTSEDYITTMHLESVPGKAQRVFVSTGRSLNVFLLDTGRMLECLQDIHIRPISAILFFRPLRLLITAAKDGCIKVWDSTRTLLYTFVGHNGAVTELLPYPYGAMIISSSQDCTLRVWDLLCFEQVQKIDHNLPVEGMSCEPGIHQVITFSSKQVKIWHIRQLYTRTTHTGSSCWSLSSSSHPLAPNRVVASCSDSAVRVVSPTTGDILTTALLSLESLIVSVCYFSHQDLLCVLDIEGSIFTFSTTRNPSELQNCWNSPSRRFGTYTSMALYETAMDKDEVEDLLAANRWLAVSIEAASQSHRRHQTDRDILMSLKEGMSFLLVGTSGGYLAILNPHTGDIICSVHGETGIRGADHDESEGNEESLEAEDNGISIIACNSKRNQIATASKDTTVYIWEMHPHVKEPLELVFFFSMASSPSLMVFSQERLAIACNNHETSSYQIQIFNITDKETYSAQPESSHLDVIQGLDVNHKLKLFASCSQDCTVRVWTENNIPIRVLYMNSPVDGLVFCSPHADLMVAIHSHLCTIANFTYFTEFLNRQLMATTMSQPDPVKETQLPWSEAFISLPPEDLKRLELKEEVISVDSYRGDLSAEEMTALENAAQIKAMALAKISNREKEILAIAEGLLLPSKDEKSLVPLKKKDKEAMWQALLCEIRPKGSFFITLPPDIDFEAEELDINKKEEPYHEGPRRKFFPPLATFEPPYHVAPDGYLPNSVVVAGLRKSDADKLLAKNWIPPTLSASQRKLMEEMKEEEEEESDELESSGSLMWRLKAAMDQKPPSPSPTPSPTPPPTPPPQQLKLPTTLRELPKRDIPKKKTPPPPKSPTPPPPATPTPPPTPPPPPTPLPEYIAQFIGKPWFDSLFPNISSKTFPKPWTISSFILKLISFLPIPSIPQSTKTSLLQAVLLLLGITSSPHSTISTYDAVLSLLEGKPMLSTLDKSQCPLVMAALNVLFHLDRMDNRLAVILLHHFVEGDEVLQKMVLDYLIKHGMVDPWGYFNSAMKMIRQRQTLDTIEETPEEEEESEETDMAVAAGDGGSVRLMSMVNNWLSSWTEELAFVQHSKTAATKKPSKSTMKKSSVSSRHKRVGFMKMADEVSAESPEPLQPISVINYYIQQQHAKSLIKEESPVPTPSPEPEVEELPRNAVLRLPQINKRGVLTRLGETHQSSCHANRESRFPAIFRQHPLGYLTLNLAQINLNPFLTEEEKAIEELRAKQRFSLVSNSRYFVHHTSYVETSGSKIK